MNTKSLLALVACSMLAVACGKGSDSTGNVARAIQGTANEDNQLSQLSPSGETAVNAKVLTMDVRAEGSQKAVEEILVAYPDLSRDVTTLRSIDRVVSTDAGTLDLYAGEKLMVILEKNGDVFSVRQSADTFTPASIEHTMSEDWVNSLDFVFRACRLEEKEQEQEQIGEQEQKGQEQQGKVEEEQKGQEQEQEQKQQQEQKEEPVEVCEAVRAHLDLEQIIEQEQEQEQKEQVEEKVEEEQKGQEQEVDKGQQEQEQEQKEQGKGQQEEVVEKPLP